MGEEGVGGEGEGDEHVGSKSARRRAGCAEEQRAAGQDEGMGMGGGEVGE